MPSGPGWPYPRFADAGWLGGRSSTDPDLTALVTALRSTMAPAGSPIDTRPETVLAAMGHLVRIAERADWALLSLVGEARGAGASWARIGAALGVSKQAAQQRFARYVDAALARAEVAAQPIDG